MSVSVEVKNGALTTGEGPHWDPKTKELVYVDITKGIVNRWNTETKQNLSVKLDGTVGFVVPRRQGGYMVGLNRTISVLDWETSETKSLAEVDHGTNNRFNDGKCDPSGRLWAGTMDKNVNDLNLCQREVGSLFSLERGGQLRRHVSKVDISNGLAWTSDHTKMFYVDSLPRKVYVFDFDIAAGNTSNQQVALDLNDTPRNVGGYPDGLCIDTENKIWLACFGASKVMRFDPETGKTLQEVTFPVDQVTSCCFGGPDLRQLYVTTSRTGMTDAEFESQQSLPGSLFVVNGLEAQGQPVPDYDG